MTPSKTLFYLCISFVVGIFLESVIYNFASDELKSRALYVVLGFFVTGSLIIIGSFLFNKNNALAVGFCLLCLTLGVMRFQIAEFTIKNDTLRKLNDSPNKMTLVGAITDEPDVRDAMQKLKVKIQESIVLVTTNIYTKYHYLDTVAVTGKLKTPIVFDDFNYQNYLLKDGIYSLMEYPKITIISKPHSYNPFTFLYEKILFFKEALRQSIYTNFVPPQRLILEGILLGNNKTMTQDLRDKLNTTGLRYLTAISGVHVIILSSILMALFLMLGFWRGQAFYFSIVFIWLYIILTGFSASGIRAAIMGSIFLLAQKLGRQNTSGRVIALAAVLMLLQNPLLLFYDVGFQLSFVASLGIIYFKPLLEGMIKIITKERLKNVVDILATTITAQVFILPIMVYNFGNVSLVAIVTSILVLPIMSWLMIFGFLSSVIGIFSNLLGWFFSLPAWLLLTYFIKVMDIFSQPWALATIKNVSWIWLACYYVILFIAIKFLQRNQKPKFLGY